MTRAGRLPTLVCTIAIAVALSGAMPAVAADDGLARLVPATAGLCVEVHDLTGTLARLENGELVRRAKQNAATTAVLNKIATKLSQARGQIEAQLGFGPEDTGVLLSGELLLAVWPETSAGADGTGLAVLRCPDKDLLERLVAKIVERQRKAGRLGSPLKVSAAGRSLEAQAINVNRSGGKAYLAVAGNVAVVSTSSQVMAQVAAALISAPHERVLDDLPAYKAARERLDPSSPLRLFLNPRRWDDKLAAARPQAGRQALVHDWIVGLWQASDYVTASLAAADELKLEVFLACPQSRLQEPLASVMAGVAGRSQLADRLPANCLAAATVRFDLPGIYRRLLESPSLLDSYKIKLPQSFDHAALTALAGCWGPECGVVLLPGGKAHSDRPPLVWVAGLETRPLERSDHTPATPSWLIPWLRETLRIRWAEAKSRGEHGPEVTASEHGGVEVTSISGLERLPLSKTVHLVGADQWLWLANSAEVVVKAAQEKPQRSAGKSRFASLRHPRLAAPSDVLFVDLAGVRRLMAASAINGGSRLMLPEPISRLAPLAEVADALLVEVQCDAAGIAIALRIACD